VLGTASGQSGSITVSGTQLAFGANTITPVATLAGGGEVVGTPVTVTRSFQQFKGSTPTPVLNRYPGFDFAFYTGAAQDTIASTATAIASATPNYILHSGTMAIAPSTGTAWPAGTNFPAAYLTANQGVAVKATARFTVPAEGEYGFNISTADSEWSSYGLWVDGVEVSNYDYWNGSAFKTGIYMLDDSLATVYLLPGEHTVTVELAQARSGVPNNYLNFNLNFKEPNGLTFFASGPTFYTVTK
jgi:hypothetical protein